MIHPRVPFVLAVLFCAESIQAQQCALVSPQVSGEGQITFRLQAPKAEKVTLNSGELQAALGKLPGMSKDSSGVWSVTVGPVPPGIYDYDFQVDGLTITDPNSTHVFGNRQGSRGYVEVPGEKGKPRQDEWRDVPHGSVTAEWYKSAVTLARRRVHIYTPPGYAKDTSRKYPVVYLLHGSGDNDSHWTLLGQANVIADNLIADGKAVPMVIVMPDGHVTARPPPSRGQENLGKLRKRFAGKRHPSDGIQLSRLYRSVASSDRRPVDGRRTIAQCRTGPFGQVRLGWRLRRCALLAPTFSAALRQPPKKPINSSVCYGSASAKTISC